MINVDDVLTNCEIAFQTSGRKPLAIRQCAENMLEKYKLDPDSPVGELLEKIAASPSPRIYLNAVLASGRYKEVTA